MLINSQFQLGKKFATQYTVNEIKNEPMFFNSDIDFAIKNGGPITKEFLELTNQDGIFDSRTHMLMQGWYPCIPGFHHDDVPRNTANGQPDYITPSYKAKHCLALINGDICPTQFAVGEYNFRLPKTDKIIYEVWDKKVNDLINKGALELVSVPTDQLVYFDWNTWHQGVRANKDGWRWFGRLSWDTNRKATNEIRNQVQVYLEFPKKGW